MRSVLLAEAAECEELLHNFWENANLLSSTPLYQVLTHALSKPENKTKFTLLFSNVSEKDILLKEEFDELAKKFPDKFKVVYYVDKGDKNWKGTSCFCFQEAMSLIPPHGRRDWIYQQRRSKEIRPWA